ncbi:MAG: hypothetical protein IIZ92_06730, partial [Aquincola sp.]|nr:hypothetical protein [Aquincola sp.]
MHKKLACLPLAAALLWAAGAEARVVRITIDSSTPVAGGPFGSAGAYELLRGTAYGEIDPADPRNALITDIELAPRNANGKVAYAAQFALHKPVDMGRASGVMVYNVPNRGNLATPYTADDPGFLWRRGDVLLQSAWQGDLPITSPTANSLGIDVPIARNADGTPVTGPVVQRFVAVNAASGGAWQTTQSLPASRMPATLETAGTTLVSATRETPAGVKSGVVTIPPGDYAFADCRSTPFPGLPDPTRLCLKNGFDPALLYELVYTARDPLVLGVGNAAMRDVIAFFRHEAQDDAGTANPLAARVQTVIGFGNSQSGRFQKHMINNGFNEDEQGRRVWDGVNTNIAGMMGSFNIRFAQPGEIAELYLPGADGPLWWADYEDTARGRPAWGLLT